jgi:tetratricopeptide (TPR) repeat protein
VAPLVKRARAAIQTEEYDEALTLLNDATTRDPRCADALWELALLYDRCLQSQNKAALTYDRFRRLFPNDPRNRIASPVQLRRETPAEIITSVSPNPRAQARDLWRRALAQYQAGRWDASIADYKQALTLDPEFADAAYNLGFALKAKGDKQQARNAFAQALAIKPDLAPAEYMLAVLCRDMNEPDAAIEHAKSALQMRPAYAEAHLLLGILYRDAVCYNAARLHFKKAAELAPDEAFSRKARAGLNSVSSR